MSILYSVLIGVAAVVLLFLVFRLLGGCLLRLLLFLAVLAVAAFIIFSLVTC